MLAIALPMEWPMMYQGSSGYSSSKTLAVAVMLGLKLLEL